MLSTAEFLRNLYAALSTPCSNGTTTGLRELHKILTDPTTGCMQPLDPTHPRLTLPNGLGAIMCADPARNHHMEDTVRGFCRDCSPQPERVSPMKIFGGPLLFVNGIDGNRVPLSPDADADAMAQLLIGQMVGRLTSFALVFHFPCGFAARANKTRRTILASFPEAKVAIRTAWERGGIPRLHELLGFFHFDFGDGEMAMAHAHKNKIADWLSRNEGRYPELLDLI
jgi:hypothetical protein